MEKITIFFNTDFGKIVIWVVFILFLMGVDILTGFIQAVYNKQVASHAISNGLLKKGAILLILLAIVPFTVVLPNVVSVSIIVSVYLIESVNEIVSILENLKKMNVSTGFIEPLLNLLNSSKGGDKNGN